MEETKQTYENEYLKDSYLFSIKTKLVKFEENAKDNTLLNLYFENTVFHPQGGGQPSDEGFIYILGQEEEKKIQVQSLEYNRDLQVVLHKVKKEDFEKFSPKINQEVELKINEEKRRLYARLHSGGHLLDMAVGKLKLNWKPGKGYHFEKSPYVEYFGELEQDQFETISTQITEICENYIKESQENDLVDTKTYKYEEAKQIMKVPDYIPEGMDFRFIKLSKNDEGCPCGGTHVKHVKDIERVIVTKIKANKNKKTITVYYSVNPVEVKQQQPQQQQSKKQKKPKEKKEKPAKTQEQQQNNDVNNKKQEENKQ